MLYQETLNLMNNKNQYKLSPELRLVETEIDSAYKSNPLINLPYTIAAWTILATAEDFYLKNRVGLTSDQSLLMINNLLFTLKYSFIWVKSSCPPGGTIPTKLNRSHYRAAAELRELALNYKRFYTAYTYASSGYSELKINGNKLEQTSPNANNKLLCYEAYNILAPSINDISLPNQNLDAIEFYRYQLKMRIEANIKIKRENFWIEANSNMVRLAVRCLEILFPEPETLPGDWECSRYLLLEFKQIHAIISALSLIQQCAHLEAQNRGCSNGGFANGLYIVEINVLVSKVKTLMEVIYSARIELERVMAILTDLTLWSNDLKLSQTEPALQPLIKLDEKTYAIMPTLWMGSAAERNWTVLMNAMPSERGIYSRLVNQKEDLMRNRIVNAISFKYRTHNCKIPGRPDLPDVDLAIIDDNRKVCLIAELKWFINPGEVREIIDRSQEIKKGISQLQKIKEYISADGSVLYKILGISREYRIEVVLLSANWIGFGWIQNPQIPIVSEGHFIKKLVRTNSLDNIADWLVERRYLPTENIDYKVTNNHATLDKWSLHWHGVEIQPFSNFNRRQK